jgi:hypothetical protein
VVISHVTLRRALILTLAALFVAASVITAAAGATAPTIVLLVVGLGVVAPASIETRID